MNFLKQIPLSIIPLFFIPIAYSQDLKHENHFPRIEIYSEKDYANQNTGSDQTTDPSGRTVYMGKRLYKPFINRVSFLISEEQASKLMNDSLNFLPYFKEQKPASTLERYFALDKSIHLPQFKKQFPKSLEGYKSYPEDDRLYFSTIIEYEKTHPTSVEVVWLNENQWFINDVFYTIDLDDFKTEQNKIIDEQLVEGNLIDFIRFSNIIQPKLSEGMSYLRIKTEQSELTGDAIVLRIAKTPGGPGSSSYEYTVDGNGKLSAHGGYNTKKIKHYEIVEILTKIAKIDFEGLSQNTRPQPFVHDGQSLVIRARCNGYLQTLTYGSGGDPIPSIVKQFYEEMYAFMNHELFK